MFYCHMCKKHMWDASSFENHVKGRTHLMMKDGVEESYRLRANMIRQEAKIEEQLKTIELERLKRMGKSAKGNNRREYCTMCDLHFFGHLSSHRKTDGHLQLKKFLHPRCGECAQEFANRIDYDTHLLMPEHMKKAFITKSNKPERRKNALIIYTEEDELKDLKEEKEEKKPVVKKEAEATADGADVTMKEGDEAAEGTNGEATTEDAPADGDVEIKEEEKAVEPPPEPEDVILDFAEGDEIPVEVENKIPKYNCNRQIGYSLLHKLDCFECHLCGRFFDTDKTAEIHSRTVTHHRNFIKFLNEKANDTKIAQKRAAAALEESERKKRKLEASLNGEKKETEGEGEGEGEGEAEVEEEKKEGDESYDPSEATGEEKELDETMDSQDGDEFEDANATVKDEDITEVTPVVTPVTPAAPTPVKVETTPVKEAKVETSPVAKATPGGRSRGRGRGGRKY